jgi:hypothetical protein
MPGPGVSNSPACHPVGMQSHWERRRCNRRSLFQPSGRACFAYARPNPHLGQSFLAMSRTVVFPSLDIESGAG